MTCRKWLVRGLALTVVGGFAAGLLLYQRWTNPEAVRSQLLERLGEQFPGATVSLDSASWRLLGGISVSELHFARRDDPEHTDFLYVPSAVIYHDKEHLLDGKLQIRKLVLDKPRLRVRRGPDGRWNLAGVLSPPDLNERLPTIVIHHGTILVEDLQTPGAAPVTIHDVNLTIKNDPQLTLAYDGGGACDLLGPVQVKGTVNRRTFDTALAVEALNIPLGPPLIQRLAAYAPKLADQQLRLEGHAELQANLAYHELPQPGWAHEVTLHLSEGKLSHAQLPLPLEEIKASLRSSNGQLSLDGCTARSGATRLECSFKDLVFTPAEHWEEMVRKLDLRVEHLNLTRKLFEPLPDNLQGLYDEFSPGGLVTLTMSVQREQGTKWQKHCVLVAEDGSAVIKDFPYGLEHLTGFLQQDSGSGRDELLQIKLAGVSNGRPIYIQGEVAGNRPNHRVDLHIWGDDIPLDDKLANALIPVGRDVYRLARSLQPKQLAEAHLPMGKGNFHTLLHRDPQTRRFANHHVVFIHDTMVCYDKFPILLENVSGTLEIFPDHHWEFRDFRARRRGGEFRVGGRNYPGSVKDRVIVELAGTNIDLDAELREALRPDLQKTWDGLAPSGKIDFTGKLRFEVDHDSVGPDTEPFPDVELTLVPRDCSIRPHFFDCPLTGLSGLVHYADRWVTFEKLQAHHGASLLTVGQGWVYVRPEGGFWAKLLDLEGKPLVPDAALLKALPGAVGRICDNLELQDPIAFRTELVVDVPTSDARPILYWNGEVVVQNARVRTGVTLEHVSGRLACRGLHNGDKIEGVIGNVELSEAWLFGQPLRDIRARLLVSKEFPDVLSIPELWGTYLGGQIYGPIRIEFGPSVHYEMRLAASQMRLEEFGKSFGTKAHLGGLAFANLYLEGRGGDLNNLRGQGSLDVPQGKIGELPPLIDLLKVFGLRAPDRTFFDEGHCSFEIQGQRVVINRLDLYGNVISVRGLGEVKVDGTDLNLEFHADPARINQLLPNSMQEFPKSVSNQVLKVRMTGRIGDIQTRRIIAPGITGWFSEFIDDLRPGGGKEKRPGMNP